MSKPSSKPLRVTNAASVTVAREWETTQSVIDELLAGRCPAHEIPLEPRARGCMTEEQRWCGDWLDCPRCGNSVLLPSPGLQRQLEQQAPAGPPDRARRSVRVEIGR